MLRAKPATALALLALTAAAPAVAQEEAVIRGTDAGDVLIGTDANEQTSEFTAPRTGLYAISARLDVYPGQSTSGGRIFIAVVAPGGGRIRGDDDSGYTIVGSSTVHGTIRLNAGDKISVAVYTDREEPITAGRETAFFFGHYIGPA